MATDPTLRSPSYRAGAFALALALAGILAAHGFERFGGYDPCPLCLQQRWAYYAAIPIALIAATVAPPRPLLYLLAVIWLASMVFGIYHSGVEWKFWPGPSTCSANGGLSLGLPDLSKPVVMCDEAAIRILGLSLAGWNAVISLCLAVLAIKAARSQGSSSVSQ